MTIDAVIEFFETTANSDSLKKELADIIGAGDGDLSDATNLDGDEADALLGERGLLVTMSAQEQGYHFTVAELNTVIGVFRRFLVGEFSERHVASALGLKGHTKAVNTQAASTKTLSNTVAKIYRGIRVKPEKESSRGTAVLNFMKKTAEDEQLRQQLADLMEVGDGDISSFAELDANELRVLKGERGALVAEFAAKHGFEFTMSDLLAVTDLFQKVQAGELREDEYEKFLNVNVGSKGFFPFIEKITQMTYMGFKHSTALPSTASDNTMQVVRFMEKTSTDESLRKKLQRIIGGDGDISNPEELDDQEAQALNGALCGQIVELGAEHGFRFTVNDLSVAVGAFRLVNSGKLSTDGCARILGLGSMPEAGSGDAGKTASLIYRGVRRE